VPIQIPGAVSSWAEDVGVDSDGAFVVVASGSADGSYTAVKRHGLAMFDSNGIGTAFIDTGSFRPGHLAIAADRSIWVVGARERKKGDNPQDYAILRKYSRDGGLLASYLPRSTFPPGLEPGIGGSETSVMAGGNRIAVVAVSGETGNLRELIELDGSGKVLGRMRVDGWSFTKFALTSDGRLYGWNQAPMSSKGLVLFDPAAGTSRQAGTPPPHVTLLGADGENLAYRTRTPDGEVRTVWFGQPAENQ